MSRSRARVRAASTCSSWKRKTSRSSCRVIPNMTPTRSHVNTVATFSDLCLASYLRRPCRLEITFPRRSRRGLPLGSNDPPTACHPCCEAKNHECLYGRRCSDRAQPDDKSEVDGHRGRKRQAEVAGVLPHGQKSIPE